MRIVIAAVGRLKQGPERELADRYRKRALDAGRGAGLSAVDIVEIKESRAGDATRRMLEESIAIANIIPDGAVVVVLDERGESMGSAAFAARLQEWRGQRKPAVVFVIGARTGAEPAGKSEPCHRLRRGDLAASTYPHYAYGADLPLRHDPDGASLSPRLSGALAAQTRKRGRESRTCALGIPQTCAVLIRRQS